MKPAYRVVRTVITAGVAVLAAAALATPAVADPTPPKPSTPSGRQPAPEEPVPYGYASWDALYGFQDRVHAAAQRILAAGDAANPSLVTDLAAHRLRVYWHGDVPARVRALAGGLGVPVVFQAAQFGHADLVEQAQQLAGTGQVVAATPKADGSGLAVTVPAQLRPAARATLQATSRVPLTVTTGVAPRQTYSRQADTPLFWGGSRYTVGDSACTNGFAVQAPSTANIVMISAGHCGNELDGVNIPGQSSPTGTMRVKNQCRDTVLIYYPAGVAPDIYIGDLNSSSNAVIGGATFDMVGDLVNTGGATSGEHGGIRVDAVDVFTAVGGNPCASVGPLTEARYDIPGKCAAAPGDSGGPVYTRTGANAVARGTITATNIGAADCPGPEPVGGDIVWYAPLLRPAGDAQIGSLTYYNSTIMCPGCGPAQVPVPQLVGQSELDALNTLGTAGLRQGVVSDVIDNLCNNLGIVASQSPSPGTLVNPGTSVDYSVFRAPPPPAECP